MELNKDLDERRQASETIVKFTIFSGQRGVM